jgi:prepilin-type N-terminal cleavage/methylation domain-containing protein
MGRGFTLVELLVVVAIIAVLASMLFPVFGRARAKARQVRCLANLRQVGGAVEMYAQDYDEVLPPLCRPSSDGLPGPVTNMLGTNILWFSPDWLDPYVRNRQVYLCPDGVKGVPLYYGNYGFNAKLFATQALWTDPSTPVEPQSLSCAGIASPADCFMVTDSGAYIVQYASVTDPWGNWYVPGTGNGRDPEPRQMPREYRPDFESGRHHSGVNAVLADGHAKWYASSALLDCPQYWDPWRN